MIGPLALLTVLVAAAPAFGQDASRDEAPAAESSFELTAQEIEGSLGDRAGSARSYYDKRCVGDASGIERDVQQVCYRNVLCKIVEETLPRLHRDGCVRRGNHEIPRDTGRVFAEQRVEMQAWRDAEESIRDAIPPVGTVRAERDKIEGKEALQACREQAAREYARTSYCVTAKLDEWRAPREAHLRRRWASDHATGTQLAPDAPLLPGMTGAQIRKWGERATQSMLADFAGRERVPLASGPAYDAFIRAQDSAAARNTDQQREKERLAAEKRSADSAERLQRVQVAFERRAPADGGVPAASGVAAPTAPTSPTTPTAPMRTSDFRPHQSGMAKFTAPPPP